jgi:hypothetical protein
MFWTVLTALDIICLCIAPFVCPWTGRRSAPQAPQVDRRQPSVDLWFPPLRGDLTPQIPLPDHTTVKDEP